MAHDEETGTPLPAGVAPPDYLISPAAHSDAAEIVRAIDVAQRTRNFDSTHLRAVVARYAENARAGGVPPERLLVAVKMLVRDVALAEMNDWFRGVLTDRAVAWTIEAYFGIDDR